MLKNIRFKLKKRFTNLYYLSSFIKFLIKKKSYIFNFPVFEKIIKVSKSIPDVELSVNTKKILFFSARQDADQVTVLTILRWSLQLRGHKTIVVGCDKAIPNSCNSGSSPKLNKWQCNRCFKYASLFHNLSGANVEWMKSIITDKDLEDAKSIINSLDPIEFYNFIYKGLPIGELVQVSIAHFLKTNKINLDSKSDIQIYKNWLESAMIQVTSFSRYLDDVKPDKIVMINGLFSAERIMLELARLRNIDVICYEVGYRPETFFFIQNAPVNMCNNEYWPNYKQRTLTQKENKELDSYLIERNKGKGYLINYFPNILTDKNIISKKFNIDFNKKTFLIFPNITWDSTLYKCDLFFESMVDWILETINYFVDKDELQLIIRAHPAETRLEDADRDPVINIIKKHFPNLPNNIIVLPSDSNVSSYVLMENAYCGIVYGSTTGIEMGLRGVPVITVGKIYYRNQGVSIDPNSKEEYFNILNDFSNSSYSFDKNSYVEMWRRYAYFAIFRSALPLPQLAYSTTQEFPSISFDDANYLLPGNSKSLDIICEGIVNSGVFIIE